MQPTIITNRMLWNKILCIFVKKSMSEKRVNGANKKTNLLFDLNKNNNNNTGIVKCAIGFISQNY